MKKLYVTFSGDCYHDQTKRTVESAVRLGADQLLVYDDRWLYEKCPDYVRQQQWLFDCPTGPSSYGDLPSAVAVNYCSFKPVVILDALERFCAPGDIVLYVDADCVPVNRLDRLYDLCTRDGIMLFGCGADYKQRHWCKRECFVVMGQDDPKYLDAEAGCATYMAFQKGTSPANHRPTQLLYEWFTYSHNPLATTFQDIGKLGRLNVFDFHEHRNEQAILANLAHKYSYPLWPMAEFSTPHYPNIFHQLHGKTYGPERGHGSMFRNVD